MWCWAHWKMSFLKGFAWYEYFKCSLDNHSLLSRPAIRELIHLPPGVMVRRSTRLCSCNLRQTQTMGSAQVEKEWSESHLFLQNMRAVSALEIRPNTCTRKLASSAAWSTALPAPLLNNLVCSSVCWNYDSINKRGWDRCKNHSQVSPFLAAFHSYGHCFCGIACLYLTSWSCQNYVPQEILSSPCCNAVQLCFYQEYWRTLGLIRCSHLNKKSLVGLLAV